MTKEDEILAGGLAKVSEAAKRLGINRTTIYKWCHRGEIPYTCINGVYRIPRLAVDQLLEVGLKTTKEACHE